MTRTVGFGGAAASVALFLGGSPVGPDSAFGGVAGEVDFGAAVEGGPAAATRVPLGLDFSGGGSGFASLFATGGAGGVGFGAGAVFADASP
jgi:hypothetical protein